ncbi:hypothetical protein [Aliarcobacter butzleri]|uniref:hypothetical protein n=1 Tax=Aliarcobacter butzleri TaxID=28197 RepID=UPI00125F2AC2|nr:hypothetical protein [Aliarcobacter butzleri]MCT7615830.1 hypothetical protein [Aliarcobacter butzleri]MCT7651339.1 hypothetical protein [Aliarcobacter butzleri]
MKSMILAMGEVLLNIFVILGILMGIFSIFSAGAQGLLIGFIIIIVVVITTFLLYLLIDIKDKISENNQLLKEISKNNTNK